MRLPTHVLWRLQQAAGPSQAAARHLHGSCDLHSWATAAAVPSAQDPRSDIGVLGLWLVLPCCC
jgi:hypothetical protein